MDLGENSNPTSPHEDTPNPNPKPTNISIEIDVGLRSLRSIIQDLRNTRDPSQLSLATSLDIIVSSIANSNNQRGTNNASSIGPMPLS
jgi:hypothetical protein